jgi:hypothetical protein
VASTPPRQQAHDGHVGTHDGERGAQGEATPLGRRPARVGGTTRLRFLALLARGARALGASLAGLLLGLLGLLRAPAGLFELALERVDPVPLCVAIVAMRHHSSASSVTGCIHA